MNSMPMSWWIGVTFVLVWRRGCTNFCKLIRQSHSASQFFSVAFGVGFCYILKIASQNFGTRRRVCEEEYGGDRKAGIGAFLYPVGG